MKHQLSFYIMYLYIIISDDFHTWRSVPIGNYDGFKWSYNAYRLLACDMVSLAECDFVESVFTGRIIIADDLWMRLKWISLQLLCSISNIILFYILCVRLSFIASFRAALQEPRTRLINYNNTSLLSSHKSHKTHRISSRYVCIMNLRKKNTLLQTALGRPRTISQIVALYAR